MDTNDIEHHFQHCSDAICELELALMQNTADEDNDLVLGYTEAACENLRQAVMFVTDVDMYKCDDPDCPGCTFEEFEEHEAETHTITAAMVELELDPEEGMMRSNLHSVDGSLLAVTTWHDVDKIEGEELTYEVNKGMIASLRELADQLERNPVQ